MIEQLIRFTTRKALETPKGHSKILEIKKNKETPNKKPVRFPILNVDNVKKFSAPTFKNIGEREGKVPIKIIYAIKIYIINK